MVQGLCASHCATTCHVCTSFQYVDGEMLSTSFLCWFSMYFLHFSMNCHFKKKNWILFLPLSWKKIVCNLAKFCRAWNHVSCTYTYWLGVVINQTFGSAKLFGWTSVVLFGHTILHRTVLSPKNVTSSIPQKCSQAFKRLGKYLHSGQIKKPQE